MHARSMRRPGQARVEGAIYLSGEDTQQLVHSLVHNALGQADDIPLDHALSGPQLHVVNQALFDLWQAIQYNPTQPQSWQVDSLTNGPEVGEALYAVLSACTQPHMPPLLDAYRIWMADLTGVLVFHFNLKESAYGRRVA